MYLAQIVFQQIIAMAIYIAIGYFLYRKKLVTNIGSGELGKILLYLIIPVVVVKAYLIEFSMEILKMLAISMGATLLCIVVAIAVSRIVFHKAPIEHFGASFSNAGFMGIPLVSATLGGDAVIYVSAFVALLNILQFTYGVFVITQNKKDIALKRIVTNPIVISFVVGIMLFFVPFQMPTVAMTVMNAVAGMNAPIAMLILGIYLAQFPFREMFQGKQVYLCSLIRLCVIPLLTLGVLSIIPAQYHTIKMAVLIAASAPVGSNVAVYAQANGGDYKQAVKDVCVTTIFSILTLPAMVALAESMWK